MSKDNKVLLMGGVGTIWGKQFHEQNRVYSRSGVSVAVSASSINGLYVRKWKRKLSTSEITMGSESPTGGA